MPEHSADKKFMKRALELALQGMGKVAPNPMVGAVLVCDGKIIGEGFHQSFGKPHAEVNAIKRVRDQALLSRSSLYVTLEPCSHFGKTPPCTNLIMEKKIPRVVIGTKDPNKLVAGRGISILKKNGIDLITGILEQECITLNKRFFTWHLKERPYIILKWAESADGFIDFERPPDAPVGPNWITSPTARILVHKWRAEEQAILVGTNTVLKDNPRLNVRDWPGDDPVRVVIDRNLKIGHFYHVMDDMQDTIIFYDERLSKPGSASRTAGFLTDRKRTRYSSIGFNDMAEARILKFLYKEHIQSVIIEGGSYTLSRFIEKGLWDEARIFTGPSVFGKGVKSPKITGKQSDTVKIGNSHLRILTND